MSTPPRLPTGTVTFLFTDIEGSTALWGAAPHAMSEALATHDGLFRKIVPAHNGVIFKTVGDAICAAFARADEAILAAIEAQRELAVQSWPEATGPLRVRMGIHTGQAIERDDDYFGPALNRVARVMSIAHGGQIVATHATTSVVEGILDPSIHFRDAGTHHLKGLAEPEAVCQVVAPGLRAEFPPLTSAEQHANNIPAQISSFVGRSSELAALSDLTQYHRLLSIVGPGGIGKTRIAVQLATNVAKEFTDGAWFVELAPVKDPTLIAQTIGDTFRLREEPHLAIDDQLIDHLHSKKLMLVLDNSEHLLAATAALAKALLTRCPGLVIVTTSREPLHITGEHVFRLPPLALPAIGQPSDGQTVESVQLFIERATAVRPGKPFAPVEMETVARICRSLEGIPLAIELAAARIVTLALAEIEKRLTQSFEILTSRDTTYDDRHRTLRATIDWSYQLLTEDERTFLRGLAVFDGAFSLDAAEAIAIGDGASGLDLSESLVDKSLVAMQHDDGAPRYALADSVKAFLQHDLVKRNEIAALRAKHFEYYCKYTQGGSDRSVHAREEWVPRIAAEIANIRSAIVWGQTRRPADVAVMLVDLASFWQSRGYISEGESQLRRFLANAEIPDPQRAPLLRRAATFATIRDAYDDARALTLQARDAYSRVGDAGGIAEAIHNLAVIEHQTGNDSQAQHHYREAMLQFRSAGHARGELVALLNLTLLSLKADDFAAAERQLTDAGPLADRIADAGLQSQQIGLCGTLAFRRGRFDEADRLFRAALVIKQRLGERFDIAEILDRIAEATLKGGDVSAARKTSAESLRIALELESHVLIIRSFETLAEIALSEGDPHEARVCFDMAHSLRNEHSYRHSIRDLDALSAEIANNGGGEMRAGRAGTMNWREKAATLASS